MNPFACGGSRAWTYRHFSHEEGGTLYAQERICDGCGRVEIRDGTGPWRPATPETPDHATIAGCEPVTTATCGGG